MPPDNEPVLEVRSYLMKLDGILNPRPQNGQEP
jgi:hypothetical protein